VDPWAILRLVLLLTGISQPFGFNPAGVSYGLVALESSALAYHGGNGGGRWIALVAIDILVVAALIALYAGIHDLLPPRSTMGFATPW